MDKQILLFNDPPLPTPKPREPKTAQWYFRAIGLVLFSALWGNLCLWIVLGSGYGSPIPVPMPFLAVAASSGVVAIWFRRELAAKQEWFEFLGSALKLTYVNVLIYLVAGQVLWLAYGASDLRQTMPLVLWSLIFSVWLFPCLAVLGLISQGVMKPVVRWANLDKV